MNCPKCGGSAAVRDTRKRTIVDDNGEKSIFIVQRARCKECGLLHTVLPNCIEPYKSYSKETIEGVRNGTIDWCCADDATIYRWKKNHTISAF